jgi:N-acetylneuraminic acid mutarotase
MMLTRKKITSVVYFFFLLIILLIIRCEEEKPVTREYPRLKDTEVTNISDSGATFSADLYSMGTEVQEEYGFLWDTWGELNYNGSNKVILGKPLKTGVFTADISSALFKDREYTVKPFVKTGERFVYGPSVTFKSLGSNAPIIYGFNPRSGGWGDTIKISGKNFSWITGSNEINLNSVPCRTTESTDTTLFFIISHAVTSVKNAVSVSLAGNVNTFKKDSLIFLPPEIVDFYSKTGYWGDTVLIKGRNFGMLTLLQTWYIKLGNQNCRVIGEQSDSLIKIIVPYEINTVSNSLNMNLNGFNRTGSVPFTLLPPYFSISPLTGTWGTKITLSGCFNTFASRNTVFFNNVQATISSVTATKMSVIVPSTLSDAKSKIKYNVTPFNLVSADTFTLLPPVLKSFVPVSGASGTLVTLKGKYFSTLSSNVKFGTISAQINSINDSVIVTKVPAGINGPVKISITSYNQSIISSDNFQVTNPIITVVNPLSGTFNDEITIIGENFIPPSGSTTVSFGAISATIVSITGTEIVARIPLTMDSIPRTITVLAGINSTVSTEMVTLNPPMVYTVTPGGFMPGQDIVITGENFNPEAANNKVFWDIYPLTVKSSTRNEIIATWPSVLPRGTLPVKINVGGYTRSSIEKFSSNSLFLRLGAPEIKTHFSTVLYWGITNYAAGIKDFGYVASPASKATYRFDPSDNSWINTNLGFPVTWSTHVKAGFTLLGDTLYLISGAYTNDLFAFDPSNYRWRSLNNNDVKSRGVAFSLNNKIYYGLDFYYGALNRYFFEIDPATNYSWLRKDDVPAIVPQTFSSYFTAENKGYVVFPNNEVWQFDPDLYKWSRKSDFPGTARTMAFSFVLGGYAYYGTGLTGSNINMNDLWKYDYSADTWTFVGLLPVGRYSSVAFTINGKAYIGFGAEYSSFYGHHSIYDFYEFDPNYPLK